VLVEIVRFTQKNGLKGAEGGWKDFLALNDKKYGVSVSDPKKRTKDVLLAFLVTFSKDFQKVLNILVQTSEPANCLRLTACAVRFLASGPLC
jgi:RNA exonuclease 1